MSKNTGDGKISGMHVMFAIACILQGSSFLTSFLTGITKQDAWFTVLAGFLVSLMISCIYIALVKKFPGKTLVQMHDMVYGNIMGKIASVLYLFFFLSLCALNSRDLGNFMESALLPETPEVVVIGIFIFVCAWAVRKGIVNLLRFGVILSILTSIALLLSVLLQIQEFELKDFMPVMTLPPLKYVQGIHIITGIPLLEIVAFLMVFPVMREQGDIKKTIFGGLSIGAATLLLVVLRDIAILGNMAGRFAIPTYESLRLINVGDVLTRMEVLFSVFLIVLLFFKTSILFYATAATVAQTFGLQMQEKFASVIGALIVLFALIIFPSTAEHAVWGSTVGAVYSIFFQLSLPLLTLIIASIRKIPKKAEVKQS